VTWNPDELTRAAREKLGKHKLCIVSNREPYLHVYDRGQIRLITPASGMATALHPVAAACGATWIAHGAGDADRESVDEHDRIRVPPDDPRYTLRRVWLTPEEENDYYYGFANGALWPLCHTVYVKPRFSLKEWDAYRSVNEKFAAAVIHEIGPDPGLVFIQDFHFALLPRLLKEARPDLTIAQFWHVPWPHREAFRVCPWGAEILDGLLGNDLLCFHIQYHCQNFLDTVDRMIEARVDMEHQVVVRGGHATKVKPHGISIDFDRVAALAASEKVQARLKQLQQQFKRSGQWIGLGVDRVDYTKGILERLDAVDRLLEMHPQLRGRFTFVQLGPLSRIQVPEYQRYNDDISHRLVAINAKYKRGSWRPVVLERTHFSTEELAAYYQLADACIVSSLHDGMNLVAKEFVASRNDGGGALILSRFTGSARELSDAWLVNPYATDAFAQTIKEALEAPAEENRRRMEKLREHVREHNVYQWAGSVIGEMQRLSG
jgi:trehalose 6-phosphate synthase